VGPALKRRSSNPAGKPRERGYSIRSTELFRLFGQGRTLNNHQREQAKRFAVEIVEMKKDSQMGSGLQFCDSEDRQDLHDLCDLHIF